MEKADEDLCRIKTKLNCACPSVSLSLCLFLSVSLSVFLSVCLSVSLEKGNKDLKNIEIMLKIKIKLFNVK